MENQAQPPPVLTPIDDISQENHEAATLATPQEIAAISPSLRSHVTGQADHLEEYRFKPGNKAHQGFKSKQVQMSQWRCLLDSKDDTTGESRLVTLFKHLYLIATQSASHKASVQAAEVILDHSYGKSPKLEVEGGPAGIKIVMVQLPAISGQVQVQSVQQLPAKPDFVDADVEDE